MKDSSIKKLYYSISEVSKITDLEQYVLRYWETEFEQLNPQKNRAGNRIYTNKEIKLIMHIKKLLREERYTIEGAKHILKTYNPETEGEQQKIFDKIESEQSKESLEQKIDTTQIDYKEELIQIKKDLEVIKEML